MKRFIKLVLTLILIVVILDYIPVKFAQRVEQMSDDAYICSYTTATDGNWEASEEENPQLSENKYLNLNSKTLFYCLNEIRNVSRGEPILNKYIFKGNAEPHYINDSVSVDWLEDYKWAIVYPIKRSSIRDIIAPKSYLTIYDFDWGCVMKKLIGKTEN